MSQTATTRPLTAVRRSGYLVAIIVNAAMLFAVNQWPGWNAVPFLTPDTRLVVGLVNASIVTGIAVNLVLLMTDPRWLKALGDVLTTSIGVVALLRIWQIFPFDFGGGSANWALSVRILLGLGIFGSSIAIVACVVSFARAVATHA